MKRILTNKIQDNALAHYKHKVITEEEKADETESLNPVPDCVVQFSLDSWGLLAAKLSHLSKTTGPWK